MMEVPHLYGVNKSNRDFLNPDSWGKNQFNSSFPVALMCYMNDLNLDAVFIKTDNEFKPYIDYISFSKLFEINPNNDNIFFSFESPYLLYNKYIFGDMPRNDLVIQDLEENVCCSSFEIKLTAIPDNSTCNLSEDFYGCELVVRPDTIIYLACSYIEAIDEDKDLIKDVLKTGNLIINWEDAREVVDYIPQIIKEIKQLSGYIIDKQKPIIIEPIWKTIGKSSKLESNCLDVFVWSNVSLINLCMSNLKDEIESISRFTRTLVWFYKMLFDYQNNGQFNGKEIVDKLSYNTKNDKAFSINGIRTRGFMNSNELKCPRIKREEIKNIILGGGQNMLSPERRFDAIVFNSPELFGGVIDE